MAVGRAEKVTGRSWRQKLDMLFMVIERYKDRDADAVYRRFREHGRMLPEGLKYLDSWVEPNFDRCFQLMSADIPIYFKSGLVIGAIWSTSKSFRFARQQRRAN